MIKRMLICAATLLIALLVLASWSWVTGVNREPVLRPVSASTLTDPVIFALEPTSAPNNLDVTIAINGSGFDAGLSGTLVLTTPRVYLGDVLLDDMQWISSTTLTATIPWGQLPGVYTLTVVNPSGERGKLSDAFTVTNAIGVWITEGPYGGQIRDLAVSPVTSQTAYAVAHGGGLFSTRDGGKNWQLVDSTPGANGVCFGPPPTYTLYYWGPGLQYSPDDGMSWAGLYSEGVSYLALDPQDPQRFWIAVSEGVRLSTNGGKDWDTRSNGLPTDTQVTHLAVHPTNPEIVFAGTFSGRVFKTTDEGHTWFPSEDGLPDLFSYNETRALAIHPFLPDVLLFSRQHSYEISHYRSSDGGLTWTPMHANPLGDGLSDGFISDLHFSTHVSGTVFASMMGEAAGIVSYDGGITWQPVCAAADDGMYSIGVNLVNDEVEYLGGWTNGVYRVAHDTQTAELATQGISALTVADIAAAPSRPETVYLAVERPGVYKSDDAGYHWLLLNLPSQFAYAVTVAPQNPNLMYAGSGRIEWNPDGGTTWAWADMPVTYGNTIHAIAIDPLLPNVMFAGGQNTDAMNNEDRNIGTLFRSTDGGIGWLELSPTEHISMVNSIVVNPANHDTVYLTTDAGGRGMYWVPSLGLGIFRSIDGGDTWHPLKNGIGDMPVSALAVHPQQAEVLYAGSVLSSEMRGTVFKSIDGGTFWISTSLRLSWSWVEDLVIDPLPPHTIYAATGEGLFFSTDGGETWQHDPGYLGNVEIFGLAISAADERTILYAATRGGVVVSELNRWHTHLSTTAPGYVQGGVYQFTIDHRQPVGQVFLPLVLRNH